MKVKDVKLEYYALNHDFNSDKIYFINVLAYIKPEELRKKIKKGEIHSFDTLKEYLDKEFMYHFWSRSEYEIQVGGLFSKEDKFEKWDVYQQTKPNLDMITEYVINKCKIDFDKKKEN